MVVLEMLEIPAGTCQGAACVVRSEPSIGYPPANPSGEGFDAAHMFVPTPNTREPGALVAPNTTAGAAVLTAKLALGTVGARMASKKPEAEVTGAATEKGGEIRRMSGAAAADDDANELDGDDMAHAPATGIASLGHPDAEPEPPGIMAEGANASLPRTCDTDN